MVEPGTELITVRKASAPDGQHIEVVTGEVVEEERAGVRWDSWNDTLHELQHFNVTVDVRWLMRADRTDVQMLHAAFETIRMLGGSPTD